MQTKLTLRLDKRLIERAKKEAGKREKSVSQMVAEFFGSLEPGSDKKLSRLPPRTASLLGVLRGKQVTEMDYKRHLVKKHL